MVCSNLHQAHLQEIGLTQISAYHVIVKGLRMLVCSLDEDESQGSSQLHGHGSWFICEVDLRYGILVS